MANDNGRWFALGAVGAIVLGTIVAERGSQATLRLSEQLLALVNEQDHLGQTSYGLRGLAFRRLVDGWRPISLRLPTDAEDRVAAVWAALDKKSWPTAKRELHLMVAWIEGWEAGAGADHE